MKVEITAKEIIKPSSSTPHNLRNFKLSLLDQLAPPTYEPLLLFYSFNGDAADSHRLKKSLSDTLTHFFPLAGRVKDNIEIDCSDYGAVYVEARVACLLSDFLKQPNADALKEFLPVEVDSTEAAGRDALLLVQSSFFSCGGVAIGVCLSHKLGDAATLSTFIKSWAAANIGSELQQRPLYIASSLFPTMSFSEGVLPPPALLNFTKGKCVVKRFVFDAPKIAALKSIAASASVQQPTRVEVVTALIWKCAMNASRSNSGFSKLSLLSQSVNIRRRTEPPLPDDSIGNLVGYFPAQKDESDIELQGLVRELRTGKQDFSKKYVKKLQSEVAYEEITESLKEELCMLISHDMEFYICTSLCNFSFYDIDFGWGKPTWVTNISGGPLKNVVKLIDTRGGDGAIEAWVILSEQDMALFEKDKELLAYASLNPSVLNFPAIDFFKSCL
ncbi:hypothetical protein Patl1_16844 [Pistacia atlantica]|uniref:Uncharacterized protein n=1 Tax=Pistacia atlantica TaxID=434234 RepID=A0ACC1B5C4_9ROSI|nr:hypothetical protein Patl1_16844 [Pistacia atlantica]